MRFITSHSTGTNLNNMARLGARLRNTLRNTMLGVGLMSLVALPASAYTMRLGEVDVQIDTVGSVGVSVRTESRDEGFLPARNGGPSDNTLGLDGVLAAAQIAHDCGTASNPSAYAQSPDSYCMYNQMGISAARNELYNYDGSINTDDGRLNFDDGDITGATAKVTSEIQADWENVRFFARINGFYDAILGRDSSFERAGSLGVADDDQVMDLRVLSFYVNYNMDLMGNPLNIRVGKQIINWGEALFILGGNSVFNPIDVSAFRRPGSEIKEALIPVEAISASLALPYNLTLEGYIGNWDKYSLDPGGSPFANSDAFKVGSKATGARSYVGSGAYSGSNRRNCAAASHANAATSALGGVLDTLLGTCEASADNPGHYQYQNPKGFVESGRQAYENKVTIAGANAFAADVGATLGDTDFLVREGSKNHDDYSTDNYGLALRWYAANLNSTDFAFYYQKYASRIPYATMIAHNPVAGPNVTNPNASSVIRGATLGGCVQSFLANAGAAAALTAGGDTAGATEARERGFLHPAGSPSIAALEAVIVKDPIGVSAAQRSLYAAGSQTRTDIIAAAQATLEARVTALAAANAALTPLIPLASVATLGEIVTDALDRPDNSATQNAQLGCVNLFAQAGTSRGTLLPTGSVSVATRYQIGFYPEYPEDIEVFGMSFNTTLFGWGVQGEIAYRPDMPLQIDIDSLSIAAIAASCAWENFNNIAETYYGLQTIESRCGDFDKPFHGWVEEETYNFDVGTLATFTRSNRFIDAIGADLGILLTEFGWVHVPDAEDYQIPNSEATVGAVAAANAADGGNRTPTVRLSNRCASGSDLPLGGVFGLDPRGPLTAGNELDPTKDTKECRPDKDSYGIALLGQLQYNNVLGTAIGMRPTIAYRRGLEGISPSPAGSFVEDSYSIDLSVSAEYQARWNARLGYTIFGGDELYDRNTDRDYASLSVSYSF